jgi:hypothetical protein
VLISVLDELTRRVMFIFKYEIIIDISPIENFIISRIDMFLIL